METNVKGFGALLAHVSGADTIGGRAVSFDGVGRLRVAHFNEGFGYGNSLLAIEENPSSFSFRGGMHGGADVLTFGEYWSIRGWIGTDVGWWWIFA